MTGVDWVEYRRRLTVRETRRAHVETLAGYTAAPIRLWRPDLLAGDSDGAAQTIATNKRSITIRKTRR